MRIITFNGNPFEIGKQQGRFYRKNGISFDNVRDDDVLNKQLRIYKKYYPDFLERCRGVAEVMKCPEDHVLDCFLVWNTQVENSRKKGCTIFGIKSKKGVFVGRNYDWIPTAEKFFGVYRMMIPGKNPFVGVSDMDVGPKSNHPYFFDPDDAINDKGLYIGLTYAYDDNWNYGISPTQMITLISETCSSVGDALSMFKKVPLSFPKNFFIADKKGDMAVVEHTSKRYKVVYPKDNILIQTNDYSDPELAKEDTVLSVMPTNDTYIRYYEILQKLNQYKGEFSFSRIIKIMGDKKSHICKHVKDVETIWCLAMDMKRKRHRIYYHLSSKRKSQLLRI
jgi:isopenicillin-N N-acyltransferase-like protein